MDIVCEGAVYEMKRMSNINNKFVNWFFYDTEVLQLVAGEAQLREEELRYQVKVWMFLWNADL